MSNTSTSPANPFQALGSEEAVLALVRDFYRYMDQLPECKTIRDMHNVNLDPMIDKLATFLVGWMGPLTNKPEYAMWSDELFPTQLLGSYVKPAWLADHNYVYAKVERT